LPALLTALLLVMGSAAVRAPMLMLSSLLPLLATGISLWVSRAEDLPVDDDPGPEADLDVTADEFVIRRDPEVERVPRADVERVHVADGGRVVVHLRGGTDLAITPSSPDDGAALAAMLDPAERAVRIPIAHPGASWLGRARAMMGPQIAIGAWSMAFFGGLGAWLFAMGAGVAFWEVGNVPGKTVGSGIGGAFVGVVTIAMSLVWLSVLRRRAVTVGSDGVLIHGLLKDRFVPFASVTRVRDDADGVELELRDATTVTLPRAPGGDGLAARIRAALERRADGEGPAAGLASLDRQERPVAAWRRELERLAQRGEGYRDDALAPDRLAAVVEDASLAADRRVGAAWMLAAKGDDETKQRIRIAADACADEDLKIALERAAEGEIEEAALDRAVRKG
jgi:hypothetical protein